jgi:hypothetical protein
MAEPEERSNHLTSVIVRTSRQAGSTARGTFETCGRRATLRTPINKAVSADFFSSVRYAAINVAPISTSALLPKAARLHFPPRCLDRCRQILRRRGQRGRNCGFVLPRSSTAWTVFENRRAIGYAYNLLWAGRGRAAYPPITSSGSDATSRIACLASVCAVRAVITGRHAFACHNRCC